MLSQEKTERLTATKILVDWGFGVIFVHHVAAEEQPVDPRRLCAGKATWSMRFVPLQAHDAPNQP